VLLRTNQKDWTVSRLAKVVEAAAGLQRGHELFTRFNWFPYKPLISSIESAAEREGVSADLRSALEKWKAALMPRALTPQEERELGEAERIASLDVEAVAWAKMSDAIVNIERLLRIRVPLTEERRLIERISRVLALTEKAAATEQSPVLRIDSTDAVGSKIAVDVAKGGRASGPHWAFLLEHARTLTSTKPSATWQSWRPAEWSIPASVLGVYRARVW
jgi:hypothetical protein